jgi:hypothetical protein
LCFADEVPNHGATFRFLKTEGHVRDIGLGPDNESVLLFLIAIVLGNLRFEEGAFGFIFGLDVDVRFVLATRQVSHFFYPGV